MLVPVAHGQLRLRMPSDGLQEGSRKGLGKVLDIQLRLRMPSDGLQMRRRVGRATDGGVDLRKTGAVSGTDWHLQGTSGDVSLARIALRKAGRVRMADGRRSSCTSPTARCPVR